MRLIDADMLKADYFVPSSTTNTSNYLYVSMKAIDDAPTIDAVQVVHGEWVLSKSASPWIEYKCSKCSAITEYATHYCPNCGAEMYGEEQEDAVD